MSKTCSKGNYPNATPKPATYGSIIVVSSTASIYGGMWGPAYTMTQHAVLGLVKSSVVQLKGTGIRINIVSSGTIDMAIELSKVYPPLINTYSAVSRNSEWSSQWKRKGTKSQEWIAEY
jgi:NAD(P)-dependent dehydrogenase (short-subunit alcohol dehydrogenase family)